ncbi:putative transposable element [Trichonephila clavipes]|nr:putative transposable element [Trichonephila clavipes]
MELLTGGRNYFSGSDEALAAVENDIIYQPAAPPLMNSSTPMPTQGKYSGYGSLPRQPNQDTSRDQQQSPLQNQQPSGGRDSRRGSANTLQSGPPGTPRGRMSLSLRRGPSSSSTSDNNSDATFTDTEFNASRRGLQSQSALRTIDGAMLQTYGTMLQTYGTMLQTDEAHFWLNGCVNKQNCRIWSETNLQVYVETPLHTEKLTVRCSLWAGGIIGSYFFKNDEGHNVTVNGDRYRTMIPNFFIPELNNHDVQELWFQQDCATYHTARATIDLLKDTFVDRLISRFGPVNWPPRSCDLTPLDYFLWGYVKSLVYADKPQTLDHLEDNCRYTTTNVGKSHQKLDVQIGLHPSQPWQSYARNHI